MKFFRIGSRVVFLASVLFLPHPVVRRAQASPQADAPAKPAPALVFPVQEPITHEKVESIRTAVGDYLRQAARAKFEPLIVLQFQSEPAKQGTSEMFPCSELADALAKEFRSALGTIAYVPESLSGYALLPVLACDEVVLGSEASLGPITRDGATVNPLAGQMLETIAQAKQRDISLLKGMLDPAADLREVRTNDGRVTFVLAQNLPEFERQHAVTSNQPAWDESGRGVLTAARARAIDLAKLLVTSREQIERHYHVDLQAVDPSLLGASQALEIAVTGMLDQSRADHIKRQISQVVRAKLDGGSAEGQVSLVVLRIDSVGGEPEAAREAAEAVADLSAGGIHSVAFIENDAIGFASFLAIACDEIVMRPEARMGDISRFITREGAVQTIDPNMIRIYAEEARGLAKRKFHPELVAAAMVNPDIEIVSALDTQSNGVLFLSPEEIAANPGRYQIREKFKQAGEPLKLTAATAIQSGLARETSNDLRDWLDARGVKKLRTAEPTWVDNLVDTLNTQWMSSLLLFIGLFMLILELKLPGVGLPAILSSLAFLLFFWSHYLGRTADTLEIVLFLAGMVLIGLELFVLPGFAVFGVSGILMVLTSVIMACHTFVWPTTEYEFQELGWTVSKLAMTIVAVTTVAVVSGKFLPSLPLFRHMILMPEEGIGGRGDDVVAGKPRMADTGGPFSHLLGERGNTTTVCRPSGRARFGDELVDVTADGFFIESGTSVRVIETRGTQVIVKRC